MSVHERVREAVDTYDDDTTAAKAVLTTARTRADLEAMLLPLLIAECQHERRRVTRHAERAVLTGGGRRVNPAEDRDRFLQGVVFHADGAPCWADATHADLEARIAYLQAMAAGIQRTIDVCRLAQKRLREHGVERVGDLPAEVLDGLAATAKEMS